MDKKNNEKTTDKRLLKGTSVEIRKADDNEEEMIIKGKAVAFNSPETYWGETEVIDPHALDEADMSDVVLRYNHNDIVFTMARTRNKSLKLEIKEDGLYFEARLIPTQHNKDAFLMVKEQLLDKCSFAFHVQEDKYDADAHLRTITKISKLFDVALVDFPFYEDTNVSARNFDNRETFIERAKELQGIEYDKKRKQLLYELEKKELLKKL